MSVDERAWRLIEDIANGEGCGMETAIELIEERKRAKPHIAIKIHRRVAHRLLGLVGEGGNAKADMEAWLVAEVRRHMTAEGW